ncbi:MAG TPA: glycosyltransferase family 4 protein, partial [Gaiellaceae bacterium]|nr:glycosyltransferase family 4 protein [Gaiellaceae bacterium]
MRALVVVVGKRTEHWEGFFDALSRRPDVELVVQAADVSDLARTRLRELARERENFAFRACPHVVGEELTGHMASVLFRPDAWRRLRETRPDVVHIIGEAAYLATYQALRARNRFWPTAPVTLYAAQNVLTRFPFPFPAIERYAYRHVSLALPITPAALHVLRAKGYAGPAKVVPLGADLERFRPHREPPSGPFTVGFVGRLEPWKGIADLLDARDRLGCRLLVVGDGSLRTWLEAEAARRGGAIDIVPWASHDELPHLLARMHALAFPSREIVQRNVLPWIKVPLREQFGRVLVEAMASGVPTVSYRVGEIPHVVGDAGLVVDGDPSALA